MKKVVLSILFLWAALCAAFVFRKNDKALSICRENEEILVEDFVPGVMMTFVPVDYEEESMKAVAVMIRTYLMQQFEVKDTRMIEAEELEIGYISPDVMKNALGSEFCQDTLDKYMEAVEQTKGEVMTYDGDIITPLYHMVSNGSTRDASDFFGENIPYMKSTDCVTDVESEDYLKVLDIQKDEYDKVVDALFGSKHGDVEVKKRDEAGYVTLLGDGKNSVSGEEFASRFDLHSSCFYITKDEANVQIITKGQGHGMGMSIYGAEKMAQDGADYKKILKYFYDGIDIVRK